MCRKCGQATPSVESAGAWARACAHCAAPLTHLPSASPAQTATRLGQVATFPKATKTKPDARAAKARDALAAKARDALAAKTRTKTAARTRTPATAGPPAALVRSLWSMTPMQQAAFKRTNPEGYAATVANVGAAALDVVRREGMKAPQTVIDAAIAHDRQAYAVALRTFFARQDGGSSAA